MANYYIGLMSGTSADGIDLALVDFSNPAHANLVTSHYLPYSDELAAEITSLYTPGDNEIDRAHSLDKKLAYHFAEAIEQLLVNNQISAEQIKVIGNHGQTIRHRPSLNDAQANPQEAFTLQIGCSQTLACLTGIEVIGQFRIKDMALGGQGAPLVPAFHQFVVPKGEKDNFVVNIGGIANITFLPAHNNNVIGFDTGPGNCLLDEWYAKHHDSNFDENGDWAASGQIKPSLLAKLINTTYFNTTAPKSTGREIFHLNWLNDKLANGQYLAQDIQATLVELTAATISKDILALSQNSNVWLCGGGRHNRALVNSIKQKLNTCIVRNIDELGLDGDALEAMAFAWLAFAYKNNLPSNMPAVTGARKSTTLGVLFEP